MDGIDRNAGGGWGGDGGGGDDPLIAFGRERRLHARAYDYWVSLLGGRRMPRVADLDPRRLGDFAGQAVLIGLPAGGAAPELAFVGEALRAEAGIDTETAGAAQPPEGTLLASLMRRLPDILAYRAPVGFEAEAVAADGAATLHRGILLPLAGEGGALAAVFGVVSWKRVASLADAPDIVAAVTSALAAAPAPAPSRLADPGTGEPLPPPSVDQRLAAARTWAALAASDRTRGPAGLHAALGATHDFLLAVRAAGRSLTAGRAVALVFGGDASRAQRWRHAAAIDHAVRLGLGPGQLAALLDRYPGGGRAFARAERQARRLLRHGAPEPQGSGRPALGPITLGPIDAEFLRSVGRRAAEEAEAASDPSAAASGRRAAG